MAEKEKYKPESEISLNKTNGEGAPPEAVGEDSIRDKIYTIRGCQVMLDSDLAELYGYDVKRLNEAG